MGTPRRYPRLDRFLHDPITELVLVVLIVTSVLMLVAEFVSPHGSLAHEVFRYIGDGITALFAVELSIRFLLAPRKRRFFERYWPDLLAVIPLFRSLRLLRVLVLLRIFRAGALFSRRLSAFRGTFRATLQEITLLLTASLALVLAGGFALNYAETGNKSLDTLGEDLWYAAFVLIGGEPIGGEPTTQVGKAATLVLMLGGLTIFGVFIGTISAAMTARLTHVDVTVMDLDELSGHTVIFGWNRAGPTVLLELFAGGRTDPVVLVTEHAGWPPDMPFGQVRQELLYHVVGDYTRVEILHQANIVHAASAILLADNQSPRSDQDRDARTVLAALTIEKLAPAIFTVAELTNRQNEELLRMAQVEEIVVADEYGAIVMGSASRNRGLVPVVDEILSHRFGNSFHKVPVEEAHDGATVGDLFTRLKTRHEAILVAVVRRGGPSDQVDVNPPSASTVASGDVLVVLSQRPVTL